MKFRILKPFFRIKKLQNKGNPKNAAIFPEIWCCLKLNKDTTPDWCCLKLNQCATPDWCCVKLKKKLEIFYNLDKNY